MTGLMGSAVRCLSSFAVAVCVFVSVSHGAHAQQLTPKSGLIVGATISINVAPHSTLVALPGIGDVIAGRIIEYRGAHPFSTCAQLEDVKGIGPKTSAKVCPLIDFSR